MSLKSRYVRNPDGKMAGSVPGPDRAAPKSAPGAEGWFADEMARVATEAKYECEECGGTVSEDDSVMGPSGSIFCAACEEKARERGADTVNRCTADGCANNADDEDFRVACDSCGRLVSVGGAEWERVVDGFRFDCDRCTDPSRAEEYGIFNES